MEIVAGSLTKYEDCGMHCGMHCWLIQFEANSEMWNAGIWECMVCFITAAAAYSSIRRSLRSLQLFVLAYLVVMGLLWNRNYVRLSSFESV